MSENPLNRIENKLDKITEDVTDIKVILAKQHVVLVEHESRSTKLEAIVLPIQRKITLFEGALKFIGAISILVAIAEGIHKLVQK